MRTNTLLAKITLLCGALLAAAPPANADAPPIDGGYRYLDASGNAGTWTIRTACTPHCLAYVTTSPGRGFTAPLINGNYTVTRTVPDGVTCPAYYVGETPFGGGTYWVVVNQWWDPSTLTGGVDYLQTPAPCGIPTAHDTFTLTRVT
jgi:hypothetical protein